MAKGPTWRRDLKRLSSEPPALGDILARFDAFKISDDRTVALLAATQVEDAVLRLLRHQMRSGLSSEDDNRLFGSMGPLASHGARVQLAYGLGCFGPTTREDLDIISRLEMPLRTPPALLHSIHQQYASRAKCSESRR